MKDGKEESIENQTILPAPHAPQSRSFFRSSPTFVISLGIAGIIFLIIFSFRVYDLNTKTSKVLKNLQTPTQIPTTTWRTYTNKYFSIQYPPDWITEKDPAYNGVGTTIYNPNKMIKLNEGGMNLVNWHQEYIDFISEELSAKSAMQEALDDEKQFPNVNYHLHSLIKDGVDMEIYDQVSGGDGPHDRVIAISNGHILIKALSSVKAFNNNSTESYILSTFMFLDQNLSNSQGWVKYIDPKGRYEVSYPPGWDNIVLAGALHIGPKEMITQIKGELVKKYPEVDIPYGIVISDVFTSPDTSTNEYQKTVSKKVSINGVLGIQYTTTYIKSLGFSKAGDSSMNVILNYKNDSWLIGTDDKDSEKIFDQILASFKFLK